MSRAHGSQAGPVRGPRAVPQDPDAVAELLHHLPGERDSAAGELWLREVTQLLDRELRDVDRARLLEARSVVAANAVPLVRPTDTAQLYRDAARAADLFEAAGMTLEAAASYAVAAAGAGRRGQLDVALDIAVRALAAYSSAGRQVQDPLLMSRLANRLGGLCHGFHDAAAAVEFFGISAEMAQKAGDAQHWSSAVANMAEVHEFTLMSGPGTGDARDRAALVDEIEKIAAELADRGEPDELRRSEAGRLRAVVLLHRDRPEEAMARIRDAIGNDEEGAARGVGAPVLRTRARCAIALGRPQDAVADLDVALGRLDPQWHVTEYVHTLRLRSIARRASGDLRGALADMRALSDRVWTWHHSQVGGFLGQVLSRAAIEGERKVLIARAERLAQTLEEDPLTRVGNRRSVERVVTSLDPHRRLCVAMVDLDHFKKVNDTFGHEYGDLLLVELAEVLVQACRPDDHVARWGGEEFLVLVPDADAQEGARLGERLRSAVLERTWAGGRRPAGTLTVSIGVAQGVAGESEALRARADAAMYAAKAAGRNRVAVAQNPARA